MFCMKHSPSISQQLTWCKYMVMLKFNKTSSFSCNPLDDNINNITVWVRCIFVQLLLLINTQLGRMQSEVHRWSTDLEETAITFLYNQQNADRLLLFDNSTTISQ